MLLGRRGLEPEWFYRGLKFEVTPLKPCYHRTARYCWKFRHVPHFAYQTINHSRSSKVTEFSTNRQHVCDFLLACHSKHGPILHRFLPLFCPNFGGVPVAPDRPCWGSTWAGTLSYNIIIINKELIIVTLSQLNTVTGALILYSAEKLFLKYSKVQTPN